MADRARIALIAAVIAVVLALGGLTYIWLSAQRPSGENPPANEAVTLAAVRTGLEYPTALAFASDGRVFYAERVTGNIQILGTATTNTSTFYTLTGTDSAGVERGLLGLALDPGFPATPYVYAYQTYDDPSPGTTYNRIVRILASGNVGISHTEILRLPPLSLATNHNGGVIAFGPDGKLYALVGENAWPPFAQDPMSPEGKVLRMNPDGSAPPDNPFSGNPSWNPLIYTYGHRNMFGLAFHPTSGGLFVTENGPECNDEVNALIPGRNFGWGPSQTCETPPDVNTTNRDGPDPVPPIWWRGAVIAPTNAAFYTASVPASSRNHLVFGSYLDHQLRDLALDPSDGRRVLGETVLATASGAIIDVEMGFDGYLWLTTPDAIYRLVPRSPGSPPLPAWAELPSSIIAVVITDPRRARPPTRENRSPAGRVADHPGSLRREWDVLAARCRPTGSRATIGSSNRSGGS
jgi:aldose sugar dehydrogenase